LLVVIGILLVLVSIFVPYLLKIREADHRVACANNLGAIRAALNQYAMLNNGNYPRVVYDAEHSPNGYTCYTGVNGGNPFSAGSAVKPNDVSASLWLLVRLQLAQPRQFICPSTNDAADPIQDALGQDAQALAVRGNFRDPTTLSYSYASPFSSAPGYHLNDTRRAEFAVMADKNPGDAGAQSNAAGPPFDAAPLQMSVANSDNHGKAGQNVLYADGHVYFQLTPYCGVDRDNIFTALSARPLEKPQDVVKHGNGVIGRNVGPAWESDSYLVPTATDVFEPAAAIAPATAPASQPTTVPTLPTTLPAAPTTVPIIPATLPAGSQPATSHP
jgi:prepilin-type processing-associated H-X9-DG protein